MSENNLEPTWFPYKYIFEHNSKGPIDSHANLL